jgi:hypothetical protein
VMETRDIGGAARANGWESNCSNEGSCCPRCTGRTRWAATGTQPATGRATLYPDLINDNEELLENSFVVPGAALADVPASLRGRAELTPRAAGSAGNWRVPRVPFVTA